MKKILFILWLLFIILLSACLNVGDDQKAVNNKDTLIKTDTTIYIVLAVYNNFDTTLARQVADQAEKFYLVKCLPFVHATLPDDSYNASWNRYSADSLLKQLDKIKPAKADFIQGLTDQDIYTPTEKSPYWGIFGLGSFVKPVSVVSTFRLHSGQCTENIFHERLIKVALHELGHNFGIHHCPTPNCMMEDAGGTIVSVDNEKIEVCDPCKKELTQKFKNLRHD